jgi:hypothetical protein
MVLDSKKTVRVEVGVVGDVDVVVVAVILASGRRGTGPSAVPAAAARHERPMLSSLALPGPR